jgi:4-amino-4-deoxy-L-arabinose transferase-like glycosyltransferase
MMAKIRSAGVGGYLLLPGIIIQTINSMFPNPMISVLYLVLLPLGLGWIIVSAMPLALGGDNYSGLVQRYAASIGIGLFETLLIFVASRLLGTQVSFYELFYLVAVVELILTSLLVDARVVTYRSIKRISLVMIVLVLFLLSIWFVQLSQPTDFIRNSDEYKYMMWGKQLAQTNIFSTPNFGRPLIDNPNSTSLISSFSWLTRYVFGVTLAYTFSFAGFSITSAILLEGFFYLLLIMGSYLLGSLKSVNVGILTMAIVATNPLLVLFLNHVMLDIPIAGLGVLSLYSFLRSFESKVEKSWFVVALVSAGLAVFIKPLPVLFILPPVGFFALWIRSQFKNISQGWGRIDLTLRALPFALFLTPFAVDVVNDIRISFPLNLSSVVIFKEMVFFLARGLGAFASEVIYQTGSPFFFTLIGAVLIGFGIYKAALVWDRTNVTILAIVILCTLFMSSDTLYGLVDRDAFLIYPLLAVLGSTALLTIRSRLDYLLVGISSIVVLSIPQDMFLAYIGIPASTFPSVDLTLMKISCVIPFLVIWAMNRVKTTRNVRRGRYFHAVLLVGLVSFLMLSSAIEVQSIRRNGPYEVNETFSANNTGVQAAVAWIEQHVPPGSRIGSNSLFEFPFYLLFNESSLFHFVLLPGVYQSVFVNLTKADADLAYRKLIYTGAMDYLVIFGGRVGWPSFYPYISTEGIGPMQMVYNDSGLVTIYKSVPFTVRTFDLTNFTKGWSADKRFTYNMENATLSKSLSSNSTIVSGSTIPGSSDAWIAISSILTVNSTLPSVQFEFRTNNNTQVQFVLSSASNPAGQTVFWTGSKNWQPVTIDLSRFGIKINTSVELLLRIRNAIPGSQLFAELSSLEIDSPTA